MEEKNHMPDENMMTDTQEEKRDPWSDLLFGRRPVSDMIEDAEEDR